MDGLVEAVPLFSLHAAGSLLARDRSTMEAYNSYCSFKSQGFDAASSAAFRSADATLAAWLQGSCWSISMYSLLVVLVRGVPVNAAMIPCVLRRQLTSALSTIAATGNKIL